MSAAASNESDDNYLDGLEELLLDAQALVDSCLQEHFSLPLQVSRNSPEAAPAVSNAQANAVSDSGLSTENNRASPSPTDLTLTVPTNSDIDSSSLNTTEDQMGNVSANNSNNSDIEVSANSTNNESVVSASGNSSFDNISGVLRNRRARTATRRPSIPNNLSRATLTATELSIVCSEVIDLCNRTASIGSIASEIIDLSALPSTPLGAQGMRSTTSIRNNNIDDDDVIIIPDTPVMPARRRSTGTRSGRGARSGRSAQGISRAQQGPAAHQNVNIAVPEPIIENVGDDAAPGAAVPDTGTNKSTQCAVCLDNPFQNQPTTLNKCGHVFCGPCIRRAITVRKKCPLCNKTCGARDLVRLFI